MKILRSGKDVDTGGWVVLTDQSRYPVRVPRDVLERGHGIEVNCYIQAVLDGRRANRSCADNRHDHFKGFRDT